MRLREWIESLKAKTDGGAYLFYDGALYEKPIWIIERAAYIKPIRAALRRIDAALAPLKG